MSLISLIVTPEENDKFYKDYKERGNYRDYYKKDYNKYDNKYYLENKEKIKERNRIYREENKDKINLAQKKYREENKERYNEYNKKNRNIEQLPYWGSHKMRYPKPK